MPSTYLAGWIVDVRDRVQFVPPDAYLTSCRDPAVVVFNRDGHFFVPNLQPGKTYEFMAHNGEEKRRWTFKAKAGYNQAAVPLPTKPAKVVKPRSRQSRQPRLATRKAAGT